ncbi:hypothetical protein CVT24_002691 [Panaeolus cyanescens]|uniref:Uncharacterized protein n=1 Tax=Panaeolus cyanescens TaxID=181874 RepID=A0A409WBB7_9AGAR|nr:hypothetical protein CVT24_002691 [Panaeolus cyanescens]
MFGYRSSAPINRLPTELLSYIFTLSTQVASEPSSGTDQNTPDITPESVRVPLVISSVCRRWRAVSLSQSSLWAKICVSADLVDHTLSWKPTIDPRHIVSYLARSRSYPLDILIDARDPEWDFEESEMYDGTEQDDYVPKFLESNMMEAISLLIPHLPRWRSFTVLTDSWAQMRGGLQTINPYLTHYGAASLESLTLMRCNDFVAYCPTFQPAKRRGIDFLSKSPNSSKADIFPKLKHLSLRGVHLDWTALNDALSVSKSLITLELASHCEDVRPNLDQFHKLLKASPSLQKLSLNNSGPSLPLNLDNISRDYEPVSLPSLRDVAVGYRNPIEGRVTLELLKARNVKSLTVEDANYPGETGEIDAGSILTYIGTKESAPLDNHIFPVAYDLSPRRYEIAVATTPTTTNGSCSPKCTTCASDESNDSEDSPSAFPSLERVTLKGMQASPRPLRAFFSALPELRYLELSGMSIQAVQALLPSGSSPSSDASSSTPCPCPQLRTLCIRGSENLNTQELDFIVGGFAAERQKEGVDGLKKVDIHLTDAEKAAKLSRASSPGVVVNIFNDSTDDAGLDITDEELEDLAQAEMEAFLPGGTFNDPHFDAWYRSESTRWSFSF